MAKSGASGQINGPKSNNTWWWTRAEVDLGFLPATVDLSLSAIYESAITGGGMMWIMFTGAVTGFTAPFVNGAGIFGHKILDSLLAGVSVPFALVAVALLPALLQRQKIRFDYDGVTVKRMGLFGPRVWSLPYSAYRAVVMKKTWERDGEGSPALYIIELQHEAPSRTVPLFVKLVDAPPHRQWQEYAKRLRLPAVEGELRRKPRFEPSDLPPNLFGRRICDGRSAPAFPDEGTAPRGIAFGRGRIGGEAAARIRLLRNTWADWIVHGSVLGLPICYFAAAWFLGAVWTWWAVVAAVLVFLAESLFLFLLLALPPRNSRRPQPAQGKADSGIHVGRAVASRDRAGSRRHRERRDRQEPVRQALALHRNRRPRSGRDRRIPVPGRAGVAPRVPHRRGGAGMRN